MTDNNKNLLCMVYWYIDLLENIDFLSRLHFLRFLHNFEDILLSGRLSGLGCLKQRFSAISDFDIFNTTYRYYTRFVHTRYYVVDSQSKPSSAQPSCI